MNTESPRYRGVEVDHPKIREYARNMIKKGDSTENVAKKIGMPHEVIKSIERDVRNNRKS